MEFDEREAIYGRDEYYWGTEPSTLATLTAEYLPDDPEGWRLLDLGAGEGRDSVFFAELGLDVCAVEISPAGLEKAEQLADQREVEIETLEADVNTFDPPDRSMSSSHPELFSSSVPRFENDSSNDSGEPRIPPGFTQSSRSSTTPKFHRPRIRPTTSTRSTATSFRATTTTGRRSTPERRSSTTTPAASHTSTPHGFTSHESPTSRQSNQRVRLTGLWVRSGSLG